MASLIRHVVFATFVLTMLGDAFGKTEHDYSEEGAHDEGASKEGIIDDKFSEEGADHEDVNAEGEHDEDVDALAAHDFHSDEGEDDLDSDDFREESAHGEGGEDEVEEQNVFNADVSIEDFDDDGDGKVSLNEVLAVLAHSPAEEQEGDEGFSKEDFDRATQFFNETAPFLFEQNDDGDGFLSQEEIGGFFTDLDAALRADRESRMGEL
eukprot:TRINITY_DN74302_c0_g1_i1.p1 TRINITY_DN74302_c0_g1~~TRINITY_DN74302_c0_g1_i1.p1  ORF type:complete len:240 (+),score=54.61 TRINITY_DN74302_c0_g1_i1:95-721(+)